MLDGNRRIKKPFIKTLHNDKDGAYSKYMDDAIFKLPTPLLLSKVVDALDNIYHLMIYSKRLFAKKLSWMRMEIVWERDKFVFVGMMG